MCLDDIIPDPNCSSSERLKREKLQEKFQKKLQEKIEWESYKKCLYSKCSY